MKTTAGHDLIQARQQRVQWVEIRESADYGDKHRVIWFDREYGSKVDYILPHPSICLERIIAEVLESLAPSSVISIVPTDKHSVTIFYRTA